MKKILFHPLAQQELADSVAYYEQQQPGLGLAYVEEIHSNPMYKIFPRLMLQIQVLPKRDRLICEHQRLFTNDLA